MIKLFDVFGVCAKTGMSLRVGREQWSPRLRGPVDDSRSRSILLETNQSKTRQIRFTRCFRRVAKKTGLFTRFSESKGNFDFVGKTKTTILKRKKGKAEIRVRTHKLSRDQKNIFLTFIFAKKLDFLEKFIKVLLNKF